MSTPPPSPFRGRSVVCYSTADWDTLLPTNKHHLMQRIAARGGKVLFIETFGTRKPKLGSSTDAGRIFRRLRRGFEGPVKRAPRLHSLSPLVLPRWDSPSAIAANRTAFRLAAGSHVARYTDPIVWIYNPYAIHVLDLMTRPALVVYHLVDDLSAVPGADKLAIREAELRLMTRADLIFCTERSLYDRARRVNERCFFMPNVADYAHFRRPREISDPRLFALRSLPGKRVVFSGNLAPHKIDLPLLRGLAEKRPDLHVVLIGPAWEGAEATTATIDPPNMLRLGHVPYDELPAYLHEADVLVIPYHLNDATTAVFPLKLFEYLAVGKPVVASPLPSLLPYRSIIEIAETKEDWPEAIDRALAAPHDSAKQRRALARRHTWDERIREMEDRIAHTLQHKRIRY